MILGVENAYLEEEPDLRGEDALVGGDGHNVCHLEIGNIVVDVRGDECGMGDGELGKRRSEALQIERKADG